jgi:hypothetical protein
MTLRIVTFFTVYAAPLILLVIYRVRSINRSNAQAEAITLPFAPGPVPACPPLLRRFPLPERVYLVQQLRSAFVTYVLLGWTEFFILALPIVNRAPNATWWSNSSAYTWFTFLQNAAKSQSYLSGLFFFGAFLIISPLRVGAQALFHRTRPISLGFLFWARVLPLMAALIAAIFTGIGLAFMVLVVFKGHVWQNLPVAIPRVLGPDDADLAQSYINLLQTSSPRIFLSLLTTMSLVFSFLIAIFSIPINRWSARGTLPAYLVVFMLIGLVAAPLVSIFANNLHTPRLLFLYGSLGPPPAYAFVAGPILLSVLFLWLASIFIQHTEI